MRKEKKKNASFFFFLPSPFFSPDWDDPDRSRLCSLCFCFSFACLSLALRNIYVADSDAQFVSASELCYGLPEKETRNRDANDCVFSKERGEDVCVCVWVCGCCVLRTRSPPAPHAVHPPPPKLSDYCVLDYTMCNICSACSPRFYLSWGGWC